MRVKSPRHNRHRKLLSLTKGYRMTRHRLYKVAHEAAMHAGQYAFAGRRLRRRDLRRLWIIRINSGLSQLGVKYSAFIAGLKKTNIQIDRKILADLAVKSPKVFAHIVKTAGFTISQ